MRTRTYITAPLTPEEEAKARALLARSRPSSEDPYAWRRWASDLTWIVPRYVQPLIDTLDDRLAKREKA